MLHSIFRNFSFAEITASRKSSNKFGFSQFFVTLASLKLLTLRNENEKRVFHFAFHSFFRNFVLQNIRNT